MRRGAPGSRPGLRAPRHEHAVAPPAAAPLLWRRQCRRTAVAVASENGVKGQSCPDDGLPPSSGRGRRDALLSLSATTLATGLTAAAGAAGADERGVRGASSSSSSSSPTILSPSSSSSAEALRRRPEQRVGTFRLANGMTFVVYERRQAPVVSVNTYCTAGAWVERDGSTGERGEASEAGI